MLNHVFKTSKASFALAFLPLALPGLKSVTIGLICSFACFAYKMRHKYVDPEPGPRSQRAAELPSWCRPPHYLSNGFKSAATGEHKPLLLCFYVIRILSCFYCLILPGRDFKSDLILTVMNFIVFYLHFLIFKHFFTQSEESHHGASNSGDFYPTSGHLCYNSVFFKEFYLHKIKNILNLLTDDKLSILISHTSQTLSEHAVSTKVGNTAERL